MALRFDTNNSVKIIRPLNKKFNLQDLNENVNGFIEPFKIGPVWVMYDEDAKKKKEPINLIASIFFQVPMFGPVLVVPSQQLPDEWDITDPEDFIFTAEEIDTGVLISIQNLMLIDKTFRNPSNLSNFFSEDYIKEEWVYTPNKDSNDSNLNLFYSKVYDYLSQNPNDFKNNIIIDEGNTIIRLNKNEDRAIMINHMIDFFLQTEEYEKCAYLKKVLED